MKSQKIECQKRKKERNLNFPKEEEKNVKRGKMPNGEPMDRQKGCCFSNGTVTGKTELRTAVIDWYFSKLIRSFNLIDDTSTYLVAVAYLDEQSRFRISIESVLGRE